MEIKDILLVVLGGAIVSAFYSIYYWLSCETGTIELMRNPQNDPDNPYILAFNVNPERWLRKRYVILKVRKKIN